MKRIKRFPRKLPVIAGLCAFSATCALLQAAQHTASANEPTPANGQYTVKRIIDGDTIRVANPYGGEEIRVRFACIDTPEIKGSQREQGVKAKDGLTQILQGSGMSVQLIFNAQDRYKRWVADVRLFNGTLVQEVLLKERLASFMPQYRSLANGSASAVASTNTRSTPSETQINAVSSAIKTLLLTLLKLTTLDSFASTT